MPIFYCRPSDVCNQLLIPLFFHRKYNKKKPMNYAKIPNLTQYSYFL